MTNWKKYTSKLGEKWSKFASVALSPGAVVFTVLTLGSLVFAYVFKNNTLFSTVLSILSSIFAGIAGSFVRDDYSAISTQSALEKKGRSALRNIASVQKQVLQIKDWVRSFATEAGTKNSRYLDEVDRHLCTVLLDIESGLADWEDIVPELKEEAEREAEITKKQQELLQTYVEELLDKKKELIVSKDQGKVAEVKKKIAALEKDIKEMRNENAQVNGLKLHATPNLNGVFRFEPGQVLAAPLRSLCVGCGEEFVLGPELGVLGSPYCPKCRM